MERRGRIPVAKFRTQEGKTRSRSRVREPDYNEQDPETDLFTLLEDNIALKEENKALKIEMEEEKKSQSTVLLEKTKLRDDLNALQKRQADSEEKLKDLTTKCTKLNSERNALDKLHKMKVDIINNLSNELQLLQEKQHSGTVVAVDSHAVVPSLVCSGGLKQKLQKILPSLNSNEMDSLLDVEPTTVAPVTSELVERLADEFLAMKNLFSSVELQLYEANEKISELIENQNHLDEENEILRSENMNLTKVAKLLTENMKESVETSQKMEAALLKLKQRNDELVAKTRDTLDGHPSPSPTTLRDNQEFEQIKEAVHNQTRDHGERIVEMKNLMEAAIEKNTNDELKTLQLKLEIMEEELRKAIARAVHAESELEKMQITSVQLSSPPSPPPPPPPPPPPLAPPLPAGLLCAPPAATMFAAAAGNNTNVAATFSASIAARSQQKSNNAGRIIGNIKQQVQHGAATGLDALVREFKSGGVTLRRNRRKTRTNDALQEMFQVLEISQKQNRDSKIVIDLHS